MENAQCGEDQNKRIQFWRSVITERLRTLKGHVINFKCVTALFTKQHAYTAKILPVSTEIQPQSAFKNESGCFMKSKDCIGCRHFSGVSALKSLLEC